MKKYIAPIAKNINVNSEHLIAASGFHDEEGDGGQFSNRRSASETIWGFDDDAENR